MTAEARSARDLPSGCSTRTFAAPDALPRRRAAGVDGRLYFIVNRTGATTRQAAAAKARSAARARSPSFREPYIRLIVGLFILLNIVNTVGEYILSTWW